MPCGASRRSPSCGRHPNSGATSQPRSRSSGTPSTACSSSRGTDATTSRAPRSGCRSELVQKLIAARESTLHHIARELHDEFGQILTAIGSVLGRAGKHAPEGSPLRGELREVQELAQSTLNNVRSLSQALHPSILDEAGLESTLEWYLPTVEKQFGITIAYERSGTPLPVTGTSAIH